jgi:TfoX/Sxy family transcriptional regulator of competence genes
MEKFEKEDAEVATLFAELTAGIECEKRRMFGCSVGFINGNMFAGVFADRLFFRIGMEDRERLKADNVVLREFEPVSGRKMKEYLEIAGTKGGLRLLRSLTKMAEANTRALPAKVKKK